MRTLEVEMEFVASPAGWNVKVLLYSISELSFQRHVAVAVSVGQRLGYSLILNRNVSISFSSGPHPNELSAMVEQVSRQQETKEWKDQKPHVDLIGLKENKFNES